MTTTLVTGATGFIGQRLVQVLVDQGRDIRVVVRGLGNSALHASQVFVPQPATDIESWRPLVRGCETVIHLIARAHILKEHATDPLAAFRAVNTEITRACAAASALEEVRRFIFVSSIGVLGNATTSRPLLGSDVLAPYSPYTVSKAEAEQILFDSEIMHKMQWTIIRPPLVYGPGAPGNMHSLINVVSKRIPLPLACVTDNRRSFVALDNLVDLLITCLYHPAAANQIFLVSDGEDISTADLLHKLGCALNRPARLFPIPKKLLWFGARMLGKSDIAQRLLGSLQVNIDYTQRTLGWAPPLSVDEGLLKMVEQRA